MHKNFSIMLRESKKSFGEKKFRDGEARIQFSISTTQKCRVSFQTEEAKREKVSFFLEKKIFFFFGHICGCQNGEIRTRNIPKARLGKWQRSFLAVEKYSCLIEVAPFAKIEADRPKCG